MTEKKLTRVQFTDAYNFKVLNEDDSTRYIGKVSDDGKTDSCTCIYNTIENKWCKHIHKARQIRYQVRENVLK